MSDSGLAQLSGLNQLSLLFIEGTRITDAGLAGMKGFAACRQVVVSRTGVTYAGIAAAGKNRPATRFIKIDP